MLTAVVFAPTVRLVSADESFLGRVELLYRGMWGTVCGDKWDLKSADVVCRQLGFADALGAPRHAPFGTGEGVIWLEEVSCTGNESSLADCTHGDWGDVRCDHRTDVGLVCRPKCSHSVNPPTQAGVTPISSHSVNPPTQAGMRPISSYSVNPPPKRA